MIVLVVLVAFLGSIVLLAAVPAYILITFRDWRHLRIAGTILAGYAAGAVVVWNLVPSSWPLSFWTTLQATVDDERFGHPLEHGAEGIVVWMMFAGVLGAVLGAFAGARLTAPVRPSQP